MMSHDEITEEEEDEADDEGVAERLIEALFAMLSLLSDASNFNDARGTSSVGADSEGVFVFGLSNASEYT